jgi:hypothetical protein
MEAKRLISLARLGGLEPPTYGLEVPATGATPLNIG